MIFSLPLSTSTSPPLAFPCFKHPTFLQPNTLLCRHTLGSSCASYQSSTMRTILYLFSAFTAITLAYREMAYPKPADTFYLKTKTVGSLSNVGTSKDSLYVTSFPVSLGGSAQDVTLSKDKSTAIKLYLDDTHLMVDMGNPSPWAISSTHSLKGSSSYVAWAGLKIDNGYGSDNFYYLNDTTGLEWTYNSAYDDIRTPDPFLSWLGKPDPRPHTAE